MNNNPSTADLPDQGWQLSPRARLVPGRVHAQEAAGGHREGWQCHQILARWHIHVSCFFQNKNRIKTNDFTCFFIDLTFFVTSTVHEQSILIQNFVIFLLKAIVIYIKIIVASLTKTAGTEEKKNTRYVHKLKGQWHENCF